MSHGEIDLSLRASVLRVQEECQLGVGCHSRRWHRGTRPQGYGARRETLSFDFTIYVFDLIEKNF